MEASQPNELEWLLDCMVEYLKSPMWTTEICDFIDTYCIFFAGDIGDENSFEHTDMHNEFKKLVETKLDGFCAEFGIDHDIFAQACSKISNQVHKKCIDQIIAVDNFVLFKKMMIARNKKLNQVALSELNNQGEAIPESVNAQANFESEDAELQRAIAESKALMEQELLEQQEKEMKEKANQAQLEEMKKANEAMKAKQLALEESLAKKQAEKEAKQKALLAKNKEDATFPDIFGKPDTLGPGVFDDSAPKEGFTEINIANEETKNRAKELQRKVQAQKAKEIKRQQEERAAKLKEYQEQQAAKKEDSQLTKEERIKQGLAQMGLEGKKPASTVNDDVMAKRRALFANIKKGLAEDD